MPKANRLRRHNWGCSCQGCYLACAGLWRPVRVGPGVCTGRGGAAAARALCARTRVEFGGWARLRHGRAAAGRARSHSCLAPDLPWHVNRSRACGSGCGGRDGVGRERGHGGLLAVERREVGCKIAPIPHCRFPQLHLGTLLKPSYQAGRWNHALFGVLHAYINSIINSIIINDYGPNLILYTSTKFTY